MEGTVTVNSASSSRVEQKILLPIVVGGGIAGTLDMIAAFLIYGWGTPRAIASGLLGSAALHGGVPAWILGVVLQFVIAYSAATVYCLSSRRLAFLKDNFFVCGLFYGIAVFLVMNLIVVPLSAAPFKSSTFKLAGLIQGLLLHMFIIGLPIAYSARRFSK
jgi:magnesium-transporting ATPase (P-type)